MTVAQHIAVVGAGMAGIACARTLVQAGHQVTVFEQGESAGGRMATQRTPFGSFDVGSQYFTARDPRFLQALQTVPGVCKPWSANTVRVLDEQGRVVTSDQPRPEPHWVAAPTMDELPRRWAEPLEQAHAVQWSTRVTRIEPDALQPRRWQLRSTRLGDEQHVFGGFDMVLLAVPSGVAHALLRGSGLAQPFDQALQTVQVAPCWALMLAYPNASQAGMSTLGPQWNAARSTHHRIAWLARESSKPQRLNIERWTVQASAAWSQEHWRDDLHRVQAKLLKAFAEVTGIRAEPSFAEVVRWPYAQTTQPVGQSHLWDGQTRIGLCGDYLLGCRVEDAFISGLELALMVA